MDRSSKFSSPLKRWAQHILIVAGTTLMTIVLMPAAAYAATDENEDPLAPLNRVTQAVVTPDVSFLNRLPWLVPVAATLGGLLLLAGIFALGRPAAQLMTAGADIDKAKRARIGLKTNAAGFLILVLIFSSASAVISFVLWLFVR